MTDFLNRDVDVDDVDVVRSVFNNLIPGLDYN